MRMSGWELLKSPCDQRVVKRGVRKGPCWPLDEGRVEYRTLDMVSTSHAKSVCVHGSELVTTAQVNSVGAGTRMCTEKRPRWTPCDVVPREPVYFDVIFGRCTVAFWPPAHAGFSDTDSAEFER